MTHANDLLAAESAGLEKANKLIDLLNALEVKLGNLQVHVGGLEKVQAGEVKSTQEAKDALKELTTNLHANQQLIHKAFAVIDFEDTLRDENDTKITAEIRRLVRKDLRVDLKRSNVLKSEINELCRDLGRLLNAEYRFTMAIKGDVDGLKLEVENVISEVDTL